MKAVTRSAIILNNCCNSDKNVIQTKEQESIVSACLRGDNVFFTGGAGTGKSTLLMVIVEKLIAQHGKHTVFVTATTGLAACAVGGTTVHQFAGSNNIFLYPDRELYHLVYDLLVDSQCRLCVLQ